LFFHDLHIITAVPCAPANKGAIWYGYPALAPIIVGVWGGFGYLIGLGLWFLTMASDREKESSSGDGEITALMKQLGI
jgi:hypothetical protein